MIIATAWDFAGLLMGVLAASLLIGVGVLLAWGRSTYVMEREHGEYSWRWREAQALRLANDREETR